jgi:hypothetical protein
MKKNIKVILIAGLIVLACVVVYVLNQNKSLDKGVQDKPISTIKTYSIKNPPIDISYPSFFSVLQQNDETNTSSSAVVFSSGKNQIFLTISKKSSSDAEAEKASLDAKSSKNSKSRLSSDKITIGDFTGFKFLLDFERSRYVLFKNQGGSTLVIDSEISAPSNKELPDLEAILLPMIASIH